MNKINLLFVTVVTIFLLYSQSFGQIGFLDSFDSYIAGKQLVCQNPTDWTTWSLTPCDSVEDPYISTNHSFSGTKSVVISEYNDLVKPLGTLTDGKWYINFHIYIPSGKAGYFNTLSGFTPNPFQWAMECYFDVGGSGRLEGVPGAPIAFTWLEDTWQMVEIFIDLYLDWTEFWFNGYLIHSWEWTQGGVVNLQLDANSFFGWYYPYDEMYIDNYLFIDVCPLCYTPPSVPSNLTAQLILNPDPQVQLNWTDNSGEEYTFDIIRKVGSPNDPGEFELIGTVLFNVTQFINSNVMIDSTYTYGILAYNHNGYSDTSNTATITIDTSLVEIEVEDLVLLTFALGQNYPNPFNPSTKIQYVIASKQFIVLKVYDVLGNEIATLVNEEKPPGEYEVTFDTNGLPSGVYFYTLKAADFSDTKKLMILK